jgi:hypothetical protein
VQAGVGYRSTKGNRDSTRYRLKGILFGFVIGISADPVSFVACKSQDNRNQTVLSADEDEIFARQDFVGGTFFGLVPVSCRSGLLHRGALSVG